MQRKEFRAISRRSDPGNSKNEGKQNMKIITNIICPVFALFAFACFALSPQARATCQEGCDTTNDNTFLGDDALVDNSTGTGNTATGSEALLSKTTGGFNTANGFEALQFDTTGLGNTAWSV